MSRSSWRLRTLSLTCALSLAAAPALAQPLPQPLPAEQAEATRLKQLADEAYLARDYPLALQRLQAAYRLDPDPRYVANQGLVHEQLGQYAEAVAAMKQFLDTGPPPDKAQAARAVIERLEPQVRVETVPPGATVQVEGEPKPRGTTPLVMKLVAGTHTLIIEREGHARWRQTANVLPDEGLRVQAALAPLPAAPPAPPPEVRTEFGLDGWGYVALGTAVAAGASGAVLYGLGIEAVDSRQAARTGGEWDTANRQVATYDTSTTVAASIAGAALLTGVVLLILGADDAEGASDPSVGLLPTAGGGVISGRF